MTRLLVLSDLHLEHRPDWSMPEAFPPYDVAVLTGDVDAPPERAVRRLAEAPGLAGRPIVYVPGNHEFYRSCLDECLAAGRSACVGTRVHLLDRGTVVLAGVRFVGATLWTDYRLFGDPIEAMAVCRRTLNDHRLIEVGPQGRRRLFRPEDAASLHARDRAFIEAELARPGPFPTVVVTHHAPHHGSVAKRFAHGLATAGFVSDLGAVIQRCRPALWIHGHTHDGFDYRVGATRILANPKGYGPHRRGGSPENKSFDPHLVAEVPTQDGCDARSVAVLQGSAPLTFGVALWTILRVRADGRRHVLGYRIEGGRGRTSSPIRTFDRATATVTTSSGNRYVLIGEPADAGLDDVLVKTCVALHDLSRHDVEIIEKEDL